MLFSLDGLLVKGKEEPFLSVAEGQQLVALYRLFHRLHHLQAVQGAGVGHTTAVQRVSFPAFLRPVIAHPAAVTTTAGTEEGGDNVKAGALDAIKGACDYDLEGLAGDGGNHEANNNMKYDATDCTNTNRAANGMEEVHVRASLSSGGGVNASRGHGSAAEAVALQICTSRRKLFCVQRRVPETNDAVFFCGATTV
ncbi:hypothetical protein TraAM80_03936 [Trypanosoma rangeli]|uniref:Uncharacterized protein n=1 Tax=Trypanosoma rangeli TaxID=5698 RepID=A0A422NLM7_TRYRA|nr:uncharacterized protein TraAM80_03936 [Trypanosoma rangeli]RNF06363.1 hypothetical protein TraAM80_03936 [Trypanosoma rangeli]|eukprot:RNF06363.1 hypothetical protein TraAM80_03936 [Trypanosoma rangeli]